TRHRMRT
ncbi:hypothetical protein KKC1_28910, partial [Calderihabitans maritimus]